MQESAAVLRADEAALSVRASTKTVIVLALASDGVLPGEKVGRAWRFVHSDLLQYRRGSVRRGAAVS